MSRHAAYCEDYHRKYKKIKNRPTSERIKNGTETIIENPMRNSIVLRPPLRPIRSRRFGDIRISYQPCNDCRQREVEDQVGCIDCEDHDNETVVFFDFEFRPHAYNHKRKKKLKRKRK